MKKLNVPSYSVLLPKENRIRAIQELYWGLNLTDEERAAVESGINESLVGKLNEIPAPQLLERKIQSQTIMESTEQLQCSEGYLYMFNLPVNTLNIALPEHEGNFLGSIIINMHTGDSPAITFNGPGIIRAFSKGFEIKANSTYEINCMYYGGGWTIAAMELQV